MPNPIDSRRALLRGLAAGLVAAPFATLRARDADDPAAALAALERRAGGRLGVCLFDAADGAAVALRGGERFPLCSTFKLPLAAVVLREADAGRLALDEAIAFTREDLVPYAPVVESRLDAGRMTIAELAEATQTTSDNAAANLLMRRLGGPAALTAAFRALGDDTTRVDRWEPEMNRVPPGELRDTTTPDAMARTAARLFGDELLSAAARERLRGWMVATRTGLRRLRAGLPADWTVGDKTGTGSNPDSGNVHNDVAVVWRPGRAPVAIAAYYAVGAYHPEMRAQDDAVLAEVGRIAGDWIAGRG
jgi:beta-lactamase class A